MAKTYRELNNYLKVIDLVLIVLDSRVPHSSLNEELLKRVKHKPILIIFNKKDLVDTKDLNQWMRYYQDLGYFTHAVNSITGEGVNDITKISENILKERIERLAKRGLIKSNYKLMIIGIPNSGKSSLINRLARKKSAGTGSIAGFTRNIRWYRINPQFDLLDTPGLLWHKFDSEDIGYRLAITGAIVDDILPLDDIVIYLLEYLKKNYPKGLIERYGVDPTLSKIELLDAIGEKRGALIKGGHVDYDRVYQIIISDVRTLKLGKITFDELNEVNVWWRII